MIPLNSLVADRRIVGRSLGLACLLGGVAILAWLVLPHGAGTNEPAILACTLVGLVVGLPVLVNGLPQRATAAALHGMIGLATALLSLILYFAHAPAVGFTLFYLWGTPYAFAYFGLRAALCHVAAVMAGFGAVVLLVEPDTTGLVRWALVVSSVLVVGALVRRITRRVSSSDARFRRSFETALNGNALLDLDGTVTQANAALLQLLGRSHGDVVGHRLAQFAHPGDRAPHPGDAGDAIVSVRFLRPDGTTMWARVAISLIREGGAPRYAFAQIQDVTGEELARRRLAARVREQEAIAELGTRALGAGDEDELRGAAAEIVARVRDEAEIDDDSSFLHAVEQVVTTALDRLRAEERTRHMALHDDLTGQPNRVLLVDRLEQALARAQRSGGGVAVLMIDLDGFKHLNDSFGHHVGDELLAELAPRLVAAVRPADTVGRLGGDEFVVICEELDDARQAMELAERLAEAWGGSFTLSRGEVYITASTGISFARGRTQTPASMLREADAAMYRAKERGPGHYELFDEVLRARAINRVRVENELRRGIERGELRLHYQPCLDIRTSEIVSVEALMRWEHPDRGLLGPGEFIAAAEDSGLIVPAGRWALEEAARQVAHWQRTIPGAAGLAVCVNVSGRQLGGGNLRADVAAVIERSGLAPGTLGLEITETVLMEGADWPQAAQDLRALGATLMLDDFGTGYSSLSYLKQLSLDVLKIDRSFVSGLGTDPDDGAIVAAIISLARTLGLTVVAEGVETEQQFLELRRLGCDVAQGFLLARPLPAHAVEPLLAQRLAA